MPNTYGPNDVRLMMSHPAMSNPGGRRWIDLDVERAVDGEPVLRLSMTPDQFAAVIASKATVVRSGIPVPAAVPAPEQQPAPVDLTGPPCTRCLTNAVWDPINQTWRHDVFAQASDRSAEKDAHPVTFVPRRGPEWLLVTLTASDNPYLALPRVGVVRVNEYSIDGRVISASFRQRESDGTFAASVLIPNPSWVYGDGGSTTVSGCPNPAAHACIASWATDLYGDCDGEVTSYRVAEGGTFGESAGQTIDACRNHADNTPPGALDLVSL